MSDIICFYNSRVLWKVFKVLSVVANAVGGGLGVTVQDECSFGQITNPPYVSNILSDDYT